VALHAAEAAVHAAGRIGKHPAGQQALEQPIGLLIAVAAFRAHKDQKASADPAGIVQALDALPAGSTALVVGHSNTLASIIAALGGPKLSDLCDGEHSTLFILERPGGEKPVSLVRVKYGAAFSRPLAVDGSERRSVWHDPRDPVKSYVDVKMGRSLPIPLPVIYVMPVVVLAIGLALRFAH
jgi:hypothetical protein